MEPDRKDTLLRFRVRSIWFVDQADSMAETDGEWWFNPDPATKTRNRLVLFIGRIAPVAQVILIVSAKMAESCRGLLKLKRPSERLECLGRRISRDASVRMPAHNGPGTLREC